MGRESLLETHSGIPRWAQIAEILRRRIAEGASEATRFTDAALVAEFKVSPMTVRQAVQNLVDDGLLVRQRGRGTFLAGKPVCAPISALEQYLEQWRFQGRRSGVEILSRTLVAANIPLAAELGVTQGALVGYVRRLRSIDGYPVALDRRYLPADLNVVLTDEDILERGFWKAIEARTSLQVRKANLTIRASSANQDEAEFLWLSAGSPVLDRGLQLITDAGRIVMTGHTLYHPDRFIYSATFDVGAS
jgi:GntR family transcriptional regulator